MSKIPKRFHIYFTNKTLYLHHSLKDIYRGLGRNDKYYIKRDARAKHKAPHDKGEGKSFLICSDYLTSPHNTDSLYYPYTNPRYKTIEIQETNFLYSRMTSN